MVTAKTKSPKQRKPRQKPVHRQFFIDDEGRNRVHIKSTEKTVRLALQLEAEGNKKRHIGTITKSTKTLVITRSRVDHLFVKGNAYGFNEYVLKTAKLFDTIRLSDEFLDWKIPVKYILENGQHLLFKQQGFELQLFVSLQQLEQFLVHKKENRRI